jgi:hypothetical protein
MTQWRFPSEMYARVLSVWILIIDINSTRWQIMIIFFLVIPLHSFGHITQLAINDTLFKSCKMVVEINANYLNCKQEVDEDWQISKHKRNHSLDLSEQQLCCSRWDYIDCLLF